MFDREDSYLTSLTPEKRHLTSTNCFREERRRKMDIIKSIEHEQLKNKIPEIFRLVKDIKRERRNLDGGNIY